MVRGAPVKSLKAAAFAKNIPDKVNENLILSDLSFIKNVVEFVVNRLKIGGLVGTAFTER
jgi:hypothetical protein